LEDLGCTQNRNIDIVYRYVGGDLTRMPAVADESARLKPGLGAVTLRPPAIRQATATIPIVISLTDPEGFGFVASIARAGGQVTGILGTVDGLHGKQLQLALEVLPGVTRMGMVLDVSIPGNAVYEAKCRECGRRI
jgi:putative ABC transport system substrate-binding protein